MPLPKAVTIGCSKTVNLGNYQSIRIEASVTYEVDPTGEDQARQDTYQQIKEAAQAELKTLLRETYRAQRKEIPND